MTIEEAHQTILSLPEVVEGAHNGHPDFRLNKSIFASVNPKLGYSALCLPPELAVSLNAEQPSIYRAMKSTPRTGWIVIKVEGIDVEDFRELAGLAHAHRLSKPRLAR